jgi:ribosomal protein L17
LNTDDQTEDELNRKQATLKDYVEKISWIVEYLMTDDKFFASSSHSEKSEFREYDLETFISKHFQLKNETVVEMPETKNIIDKIVTLSKGEQVIGNKNIIKNMMFKKMKAKMKEDASKIIDQPSGQELGAYAKGFSQIDRIYKHPDFKTLYKKAYDELDKGIFATDTEALFQLYISTQMGTGKNLKQVGAILKKLKLKKSENQKFKELLSVVILKKKDIPEIAGTLGIKYWMVEILFTAISSITGGGGGDQNED